MTRSEIKYFLQIWRFKIKSFPGKIKRIMWNGCILLGWHRLWVREDEFHKSLNMDILAMMEMSRKRRQKYLKGLLRRREVAHRRDC